MKRGGNLALNLGFLTRGRWHGLVLLQQRLVLSIGHFRSITIYTAAQMNGLKDTRHCTVNAAICAVVPSSVAAAELQRRNNDEHMSTATRLPRASHLKKRSAESTKNHDATPAVF